jgi:hypothetical protein
MEVVDVHGGVLLVSSSMDDLFTLPIPTSSSSMQSHFSKAYVGKIEDVYVSFYYKTW